MKSITTFCLLLVVNFLFSQSKKSLLAELNSYAMEQIYNKPIDAEYKDIFNALIIVGNQEYPTLVKESESRGYVDFKLETETVQESLSMEILGDMKPYRINYLVRKQTRSIGLDGKYTNWTIVTNSFNQYIFKLQYNIHKILFGELIYPQELIERVEKFNATQKKERNKILKGIDY